MTPNEARNHLRWIIQATSALPNPSPVLDALLAEREALLVALGGERFTNLGGDWRVPNEQE